MLNGMLLSGPGRRASHGCAENECLTGARSMDVGEANIPVTARGRAWKKHHLKSVQFNIVREYPESKRVWYTNCHFQGTWNLAR